MNRLENLKNYIDECIRNRARRRRLYAVVTVLSMLVALGVAVELVKPAVTATAPPECGHEAHVHGESCYETHRVCGLEEDENHQHDAPCYVTVLNCQKEQHTHNEDCYPQTLAEVTMAPTATPEVTATPEATITAEATATPEVTATAEATVTAEATATPEVTATIMPFVLTAQEGTNFLLAGETGMWPFEAIGAQTIEACILSADGTAIYAETLSPDAAAFSAVLSEAGLYTVRLAAVCGEDVRMIEWPVVVSGGVLKAEVAASCLSCFGGENVTFSLSSQGGVAPVTRHVTVYQAGELLWDAQSNSDEAVRVTALTLEEASDITVKVVLTGADGETAEAQATIPCAQRKTESRAQWEASFKEVELEGVWPEDLLAIARTQLGYEESSVNFIINDDGQFQGYTRYGAWYGASYSEWCAMYVSFCLNYAEIPPERFPLEANCEKWIRALKPLELYEAAQESTPRPGDLVFFDWEQDGKADHVGLVEAIEDGKLLTIEGNSRSSVRRNRYDLDNSVLFGYGLLNQAYERWLEEQPTLEPSAEPDTEATLEPSADPDAEATLEPSTEPEATMPPDLNDGQRLEWLIGRLVMPAEEADNEARLAYAAQLDELSSEILALHEAAGLDGAQAAFLLNRLAERQLGGASARYMALYSTLQGMTQPAADASTDVKLDYDTMISALREQAASAQASGELSALEAATVQLMISDRPVCPVQCLYTALEGAVSLLHEETDHFSSGVLTAVLYDTETEDGARYRDELLSRLALEGQGLSALQLLDIDFAAETTVATVSIRLDETLAACENLRVAHRGAEGWQWLAFERLTDETGQSFVTFQTDSFSPFAVAALSESGVAGADMSAYLTRAGGQMTATLTDADHAPLERNEEGLFTVRQGDAYGLTLVLETPGGFETGAYVYTLPAGVVPAAGEGAVMAGETAVGRWSADESVACVRLVLDQPTTALTITLSVSFQATGEPIFLDETTQLNCIYIPDGPVAEVCKGENWKILRDSGYFEYWSTRIEAAAEAQAYAVQRASAQRTGERDAAKPSDFQVDSQGGSKENKEDGVKVSKTIRGTDLENVFDITLTVETPTEISSFYTEPDMAVVIVMDISNTMTDNFGGVTRYAAAMEAAEDFLDRFAAQSAGVSRIGYVAFNTDAHQIFGLQECSTETQATVLKNTMRTTTGKIINALGYGESHSRFTNVEAGLKMASDMLAGATNKNKYIIFLSDGFPTTYVLSGYDGYDPYDSAGKHFYDDVLDVPCSYGTSYSDTAAIKAREMAVAIKASGTKIFSIGVDVGGQTIQEYVASSENSNGFSVVDRTGTTYEIGDATSKEAYKDWLKNSIGSGYYYDSTNTAGLKAAYEEIFEEIEQIRENNAEPIWVTEDPLPPDVEFIGLYTKDPLLVGETLAGKNEPDSENTAEYKTSEAMIRWDLKQSGYTTRKDGNKTIYQYSLTYRVRLKNEQSGFVEKQSYATNGDAKLTYQVIQTVDGKLTISPEKTIDYPIPSVHGYLAELAFDKRDGAGGALAGAEFTLRHNTDQCPICRGDGTSVSISDAVQVSGEDGRVTFSGIASGHVYTLWESKVPENYIAHDARYTVTVAYDQLTVTDENDEDVSLDGFVIINQGKPRLPETGGTGTLPYTIGGIALMAISLLYGCTLGRRRERRVKH